MNWFQNLNPSPSCGALWNLLRCLLLTAILSAAGDTCAQTDGEQFVRIRSLFAERKLELDIALSQSQAAFLMKYTTAVDEIRKTPQAAGDLEGVVAAQAEGEAARSGSLLQRQNVETLPPQLLRVREEAEVEIKKGLTARQADLGALRIKYVSALEALKSDYTKAGDVETAVKVAAEIAKETNITSIVPPGFEQSLSDLPATLQAGLILWIPFDDEGTDHVTDISASALVGVLRGTEFVKEGRIGGARSFDGMNDQVDLGARIPDSETLSISAWIKYSGKPNTGGIFCDFNGVSANDLAFSLLSDGSVHLRADKSGKTFQAILKLDRAPTDAWHHLVWVMDSRDSVLYLDGEVVGEVREEGSNVGFHGAFIGWSHDGISRKAFGGLLDEFMMWGRALGKDEVVELWKRGQ